MTHLHKPVKRLTCRANYKGRKLVIELRPGLTETVFIREMGRRIGYTLPIEYIFKMGARLEAEAQRVAKAKKRK